MRAALGNTSPMTALHPFLDHPRPLAIAHRGGALEAEENTLPAFDRAVALGYSHVELDVQATADGAVVIHHDLTLERMTGDPRLVADLTQSQIAALRTPGGAAIPLLSDLLESHPTLFVNIEPKSDAVIEPLADLIRSMGVIDRIAVGAFRAERIERLRDSLGAGLCVAPAWRGVLAVRLAGLGLPVARPDADVLQVPTQFRGIPVVVPSFIRAARRFGMPVQVWTVNDGAEIVRLLEMGVDALMTDRPAFLRELLKKRGEWRGRDA